MDGFIKKYMDEHKVCIEKLDAFEKKLSLALKESNYKLSTEINSVFGDFFDFLTITY